MELRLGAKKWRSFCGLLAVVSYFKPMVTENSPLVSSAVDLVREMLNEPYFFGLVQD